MKLNKAVALCLAFAMAMGLAACGAGDETAAGTTAAQTAAPPGEAAGEKLVVVTTVFAPYDFIREVAGEYAEVSMLLPPGSETHSFEPTPQDMIAIQNSEMFIYVGGESDGWVETILNSMDRDAMTIVALMDLVDVVEEEVVEGMQTGHSHDDEDDYSHGEDEAELDEHVWTSPKNAMRIVNAFAETLAAIDGENAQTYRANADDYIARLGELDAAFEGVVQNAARKTLVFGDRFPFRYFADAYGLDYNAAFPGCSTETEPSAQTVAFLINKVADEQIPTVFYIEMSNQRMADTICEATGADKLLLHSCHNVTKDEMQAGETYLSLMWQNVENLQTALA